MLLPSFSLVLVVCPWWVNKTVMFVSSLLLICKVFISVFYCLGVREQNTLRMYEIMKPRQNWNLRKLAYTLLYKLWICVFCTPQVRAMWDVVEIFEICTRISCSVAYSWFFWITVQTEMEPFWQDQQRGFPHCRPLNWTDTAPPGYPWSHIAVPLYQFRSLDVSKSSCIVSCTIGCLL